VRIDRSGDASLDRGGDQFGNGETHGESAAGDVFARRDAGRDGWVPRDAPDPRDRDDSDRDGMVEEHRQRPVREGLPKRFSMRHTRHYVDELLGDAPLRTVREIPISEIEAPVDEALNLEPLEESIREFGVIEPLLVARRDADYRVITGMRRLRAARTVGLSTVPCLVQDVDDDRLQSLRRAALGRVAAPAPVIISQPGDSDAALAAFAFDADTEPPIPGGDGDVAAGLRSMVLDEIASIESLRERTASSASDFLSRHERAECFSVSFQEVMAAVVAAVASEARLRGIRMDVRLPEAEFRISLDAPRWKMSLIGLLQALFARVDRPGVTCRIAATVTILRPALILTCDLEQPNAAPLDDETAARFFDASWSGHPCGTAGAIALGALAKTARAHGGRVQVRESREVLVVVPRPLAEV